MYEKLTKYLSYIDEDSFGKWIYDKNGDGTKENPYQMPYVSYSDMIRDFLSDVYVFIDNHPEFELASYKDILHSHNIDWNTESMEAADVRKMDGKGVMALIVGIVRADRFCDGVLLSFLKNGTIMKWVKRLKEIDEQ